VVTKQAHATQNEAIGTLKVAVDNFKHPVFPCALIAGDVVLLHLLHRSQLLPKVPVVFVDTLHLFPETHDFLKQCEASITS
jgi:phosphoadenosine phosphosulfate reductase